MTLATRRRLTIALLALAGGVLVALLAVYFRRGFIPGDALVYLAAGERLNVGHDLYALVAGDRPVHLQPPYWTVPLLSPPFIAVIWRPLATLPSELGMYLWWLGSIGSIVGVIVALAIRRPLVTALALLALAIPITYEIGVGNVNGYILLGAVLAWRWFRAGSDIAAGATVGVMTALKVYPGVLAVFLAAQRRGRALLAWVAAIAVAGLVSLAGAGFAAHLRYLEIARATGTIGTSDLSLGGLARWAGMDSGVAALLPMLALGVGVVAVVLTRRHPTASFMIAVVTMVFGSPVVNVNTPTLLLAALAPLAWPYEPAIDPVSAVDSGAPSHPPSADSHANA